MGKVYPKDTPSRKICSKAEAIIHYKMNSEYWLYKPESGNDVGRDCILELSENDEWRNHKIECQIKGTINLHNICKKKYISMPIDVKTFLYALNSPISFVLLVVDVKNESVYYLCLQDYFNENKKEIEPKLNNNQKISIRIPVENILSENDMALQNLAKKKHII